MNFFADIKKIATPHEKLVGSAKSPLDVMKEKFASKADEQIAALKAGETKGRWFETDSGTGKYVVFLRNANRIMPLDGNTHYMVAKKEDAIKFIELAKAACAAGEFDKLLEETKREPNKVTAEDGTTLVDRKTLQAASKLVKGKKQTATA